MTLEETKEQVWKTIREHALLLKEEKEAQKRSRLEADRRSADLDRQLRELGKKIEGLSDKFGSFTEGMALPSMEKILRKRFHMDVISPSVRVRCNGRNMELDVLAYSERGVNEAYIVEVKSHLRERSLQQLLRALKNFPDFFPGLQGRKLYGILAAVDASPETRQRVLRQGIYFARIKDDVFRLDLPEGFRPRAFPNPPPD